MSVIHNLYLTFQINYLISPNNLQPCPEGSSNYRADQCAAFNNKTYNGQQFNWVPYYDKSKFCYLQTPDL